MTWLVPSPTSEMAGCTLLYRGLPCPETSDFSSEGLPSGGLLVRGTSGGGPSSGDFLFKEASLPESPDSCLLLETDIGCRGMLAS